MPFIVSDMSQERVVVDLAARSKLKTSEIFRGAGNSLTSNTQLVQKGGKLDLLAKYKNNSAHKVTATFETALINARVDPSYLNSEYGMTTRIVTLEAGQSGSFLIKALAGTGRGTTASAETRVTVNGDIYDFGWLSVDVANVTLFAQSASVGVWTELRNLWRSCQKQRRGGLRTGQ